MKVNFLSEYKKRSGNLNMENDLSMLNYAIKNGKDELYVRFYGWEPACVSFGRNQKMFDINVKIDVVKRPTGGRALLHKDEITYCVAGKIPEGQGVLATYEMISDVLIKGFKTLGVELEYGGKRGLNMNYCMNISTGADICYKGKKLIGSAQYRKQGYFLQHGSILKSADFELIKRIFKEPVLEDKIITLNEILPKIKDTEVIEAIKRAFINAF